jgi:hypothetical protein
MKNIFFKNAGLLALLLLTLPAIAQAQFTCTTNNGAITIMKYSGGGGAVVIPDTIAGLPVTSIGKHAFYNCSSLTSIKIGQNVTSIGGGAFDGCASLREVYFPGSAPEADSWEFVGDNKATVYYLPGTKGWDPTFGGIPTVLQK